jgi:hypothetical protein
LGRFSVEIECVIAEAIDVLREVWADGCDGIFGNELPSLLKYLKEPGQGAQVMEDQAVGHQMVVFDGFPLFIAAVLRDDAFAAEEGPLEEAILYLSAWLVPECCKVFFGGVPILGAYGYTDRTRRSESLS